MATLERDGAGLAYEETGKGAAGRAPVVLIHGWTCDRSYLAPQRDHLARERRVVSLDLRGHGESDRSEQAYTIAAFADDVRWLCAEIGLERPIVVGHSMGGMVGVEIARQAPDLPAAVVALDSPLVPPPALVESLQVAARELHGPGWRAFHRPFLEQALFLPTDDPKRKEAILDDMTSSPRHVVVGCFDAIAGYDAEAAIAACRVPFLYVGAEPPLGDVLRIRSLREGTATGQTVGAGHFHQLEVPEQVNAMIDRFLANAGL